MDYDDAKDAEAEIANLKVRVEQLEAKLRLAYEEIGMLRGARGRLITELVQCKPEWFPSDVLARINSALLAYQGEHPLWPVLREIIKADKSRGGFVSGIPVCEPDPVETEPTTQGA